MTGGTENLVVVCIDIGVNSSTYLK